MDVSQYAQRMEDLRVKLDSLYFGCGGTPAQRRILPEEARTRPLQLPYPL